MSLCEVCRKEIVGKRRGTRLCGSRECMLADKKEYWRTVATSPSACLACGATGRKGRGLAGRFCGPGCSAAWAAARDADPAAPRCVYCRRARAERKDAVTCGDPACRDANRADHGRAAALADKAEALADAADAGPKPRAEKPPRVSKARPPKARPPRRCLACLATFAPSPSSRGRFCSPACRTDHYRRYHREYGRGRRAKAHRREEIDGVRGNDVAEAARRVCGVPPKPPA